MAWRQGGQESPRFCKRYLGDWKFESNVTKGWKYTFNSLVWTMFSVLKLVDNETTKQFATDTYAHVEQETIRHLKLLRGGDCLPSKARITDAAIDADEQMGLDESEYTRRFEGHRGGGRQSSRPPTVVVTELLMPFHEWRAQWIAELDCESESKGDEDGDEGDHEHNAEDVYEHAQHTQIETATSAIPRGIGNKRVADEEEDCSAKRSRQV